MVDDVYAAKLFIVGDAQTVIANACKGAGTQLDGILDQCSLREATAKHTHEPKPVNQPVGGKSHRRILTARCAGVTPIDDAGPGYTLPKEPAEVAVTTHTSVCMLAI